MTRTELFSYFIDTLRAFAGIPLFEGDIDIYDSLFALLAELHGESSFVKAIDDNSLSSALHNQSCIWLHKVKQARLSIQQVIYQHVKMLQGFQRLLSNQCLNGVKYIFAALAFFGLGLSVLTFTAKWQTQVKMLFAPEGEIILPFIILSFIKPINTHCHEQSATTCKTPCIRYKVLLYIIMQMSSTFPLRLLLYVNPQLQVTEGDFVPLLLLLVM